MRRVDSKVLGIASIVILMTVAAIVIAVGDYEWPFGSWSNTQTGWKEEIEPPNSAYATSSGSGDSVSCYAECWEVQEHSYSKGLVTRKIEGYTSYMPTVWQADYYHLYGTISCDLQQIQQSSGTAHYNVKWLFYRQELESQEMTLIDEGTYNYNHEDRTITLQNECSDGYFDVNERGVIRVYVEAYAYVTRDGSPYDNWALCDVDVDLQNVDMRNH